MGKAIHINQTNHFAYSTFYQIAVLPFHKVQIFDAKIYQGAHSRTRGDSLPTLGVLDHAVSKYLEINSFPHPRHCFEKNQKNPVF